MYCKKCGFQITNDSIFCSQCGQKQDEQISPNLKEWESNKQITASTDEDTPMPPSAMKFPYESPLPTKEKSGCGCGSAIAIFIVSVIALILILVITNPGFSLKTDATINDIDIDYELDIYNLSLDMIIVPECNIKNLEITFAFYDENNNYLFDIEKNIGNVKEGEAVNRRITLFEFDSKVFKVDKVRTKVTKGTKSIFK